MNQVIRNLVSNAFKFTPEGGTVTIIGYLDISENSIHAVISVKDTGAGISKVVTKSYCTSAYPLRDSENNIYILPLFVCLCVVVVVAAVGRKIKKGCFKVSFNLTLELCNLVVGPDGDSIVSNSLVYYLIFI